MGNPLAVKAEVDHFLDHRKRRQALFRPDGTREITDNHLNHELIYLKSAFNELVRLNRWQHSNPFKNVKKLALDETELSFLTSKEIKRLLAACVDQVVVNSDLITIVKICLATGCRFGEAQTLRTEQIHHGQLHFSKTKTKKNRSVPINQNLEDHLLKVANGSGRLFTKTATNAFSNAIDRADIKLPTGQLTHVLRHTFASHYIMNGGDILKLNKVLGHKTIQMTMRYAHLAPGHLEDAKTLNPLAKLDEEKTQTALTPS